MVLLTTIAQTLKMFERRSKTFETSRLKPQNTVQTNSAYDLFGLRWCVVCSVTDGRPAIAFTGFCRSFVI